MNVFCPSRRVIFSRSVNNFNDSNANATTFAWIHRGRPNINYSACRNRLRPCHAHSGRLQEEDLRESGSHPNYLVRDGEVSLRPFMSLMNNRHTSSVPFRLVPKKPERDHMNIFIRFASSKATMSKLDFSTIPNTTSADISTGPSGDLKRKQEKEREIDSLPASQKVRDLFKKYGAVFVGTYLGIYGMTLATFFIVLDFGLLDPDVLSQLFKVSKDMACETADIIGPTGTGASMNEAAELYADEVNAEISKDRRSLVEIISGYLQNWEWSKKYADKLSDNPHLANLAISWFAVKFTEPVRLAAAVVLTPKVSKALGRE